MRPAAAAVGHAQATAGGATAVLLVGLTIWIVFWLRGKLTIGALIVCGTWGLLLGSTAFGIWLHGPLGSLGSWVMGLAS